MNLPPREGGRKSVGETGSKMNLLLALSGAQLVILIVILIVLLLPSGAERSDRSRASQETSPDTQLSENATDPADEPRVETAERGDLPPEVSLDRPVRIEILNGVGVSGLAAAYANVLRKEGYDIRDTRNADRMDYENSYIYDRTGLEGQAVRLAQILGIPTQRIIRQSDPQLVDIDLSLILGSDYRRLKLQP